MELLYLILLSIVQGVTEWLPISSSGHLVLIQEYFKLNVSLSFDIFLHLATLFVAFVFFRKDILYILRAFRKLDFKSEYGKLGLFVIIGSIPTAIIGLLFQEYVTQLFTNVLFVGCAFIFTGCLLFATRQRRGDKELDGKKSFIIGVFQGIALIPGVSRSGSTISAGLFLGVDRVKVARYSFLLMIPAVLGAFFLQLKDFVSYDISLSNLMISFFVTFVVGFFSLKFLLKIIKQGKFYYFAYYCWFVGLVVLLESFIF